MAGIGIVRVPVSEYVNIPAGDPGGNFTAAYSAARSLKQRGEEAEQAKIERAAKMEQDRLRQIEEDRIRQAQLDMERDRLTIAKAREEREAAMAARQQQGMVDFQQGFRQSLNDLTMPQVPMRRQAPTADQVATALQSNIGALQDPATVLEATRAISGLRPQGAEALQVEEMVGPGGERLGWRLGRDAYWTVDQDKNKELVPINDPRTNKPWGLRWGDRLYPDKQDESILGPLLRNDPLIIKSKR